MNINLRDRSRTTSLLNNFNHGFTLIELLVTIIIIGVLGAVALPSFLNQVAKARGSEAKGNMGAINRAQQAYRWENNTFATDITHLNIRLNSKFYDYDVINSSSSDAKSVTTSKVEELKALSAAISQSGDSTSAIVCESNEVQVQGSIATAPIGGAGVPFSCPANYDLIE